MQYYMAPLEGITTYWYRRVHQQQFDDFDKYFTPFIVPHTKRSMNTREKKEILPENNEGLHVVPQIMTNHAEDFIRLAGKLQEYGYEEVNLNLGCPSGTVTASGKGAGFLADPARLEMFLEEIYDKMPDMHISIKTRLGIEDPEEFDRILNIYNQYPVYELIIHPRVQQDYYKNQVNLDAFAKAYKLCKHPLVYNGDIFSREDADKIEKRFPQLKGIMLGRGVIANPCLMREIRTGESANKKDIRLFHDAVYSGYQTMQSGDKNVLFKMKELWAYMGCMFENYIKYGKQINKSDKCYVYNTIVDALFREQELKEKAGFVAW